MSFTSKYTKLFRYLLPTPFTIAIVLSVIAFTTAFLFTKEEGIEPASYAISLLSFWEKGLWNNALLVFAMQMMLMLVLGHVLALTPIVDRLLNSIVKYANSTAKAAFLVSFFTILVALFNWGLGLIFGAIFSRKVGEYAAKNNMTLNYPLIGAAGYSGLMVWHGGISGSSLTKVAEKGHLHQMMSGLLPESQLNSLPNQISFSDTVFSPMNLSCIILLLIVIPTFMYWLGKKSSDINFSLSSIQEDKLTRPTNLVGAERLDYSVFFSRAIGLIILFYAFYKAFLSTQHINLNFITPNFINLSLLGLGVFLHQNFSQFLKAVDNAITGAAGILIQFPLYFGIMGIMKESGMVSQLADFFVSISSPTSFPIYTLISAGLVNIFVPSGGGQWAIQGPIIIQATIELGTSLPKNIMALAYGDQLTNMLQPFWALPLLGITGLKAKEILPYTLLLMGIGIIIYTGVLLAF